MANQNNEIVKCIIVGRYVTTQDLEKADLILNSLGVAQQVPEKMINSIGALAGSGPAYVIINM